jgi:molecular chaperone DnaK
LTGIPAAPRGVPQIEVSFEIDVNGILKVSAEDKGTGREQSIVIKETGGLSQEEIERMQQEAEQYAEQDRKRMQLVELSNQADNLFYSHETTLKDNEGLIPEKLKAAAEQKKQQLVQALDNPEQKVEVIQTRLEEYRQAVLTMGTQVYSKGNDYQQSSSRDYETVGEEDITQQLHNREETTPQAPTQPQQTQSQETSELEEVFGTYNKDTQASQVVTDSDDEINLKGATDDNKTQFEIEEEDFNPFEEFEEEDDSSPNDYEAVE